jgi:hypothetical protein
MPGMLTKRYFYKNPGFWRWGISIALIVLMIYAFWKELSFLVDWLTGQQTLETTDLSQIRNLFVLTVSFVGFFVILYLSMMFVSQFVLPIQAAEDRKRVFDRMMRYLTRSHGPAIFVREGREIAKPEELRSSRAGVAFVDLSSAIVLEKQYFAGGSRTVTGAGTLGKIGGSRKRKAPKGKVAAPPIRNARAAGPGIVFTGSGERIRGAVSLRRQFRLRPNVKGITRDGFEVFSHIFAIFTLGEPPEVLKVTYTGDSAESIQVIQIDGKTNTIKGFSDELDLDDKYEIHRWFQTYKPSTSPPAPVPSKKEPEQAAAPYTFDAERVFNAVYGNARVIKEGLMEDWTELPLKVAVEAYHDMLAMENYDALYLPEDPTKFPFRDEFRPRYAKRLRNLGVLGYQMVLGTDVQPLEKDQPWDETYYTIYPAQVLRTSKILRDRGIRLIAAGFAELRPSNPAVLLQRQEHWRARWQKESNLTLAEYDYKEMKIRSHARAMAQKDMVDALSNLIKSQDLTREAVAIRLFQAIESFAKEPQTEKLLPKETLNALWSLHEWLLPAGNQRSYPSEHPEKAFPDE